MKPSLYVETTIASFVVGGISPVLATAAHQGVTRRWWEERRHEYRLHISSLVERVNYLLTWNLKHLANGHVRRALERLHDAKGIFVPTICTPDELLDWEDEVW